MLGIGTERVKDKNHMERYADEYPGCKPGSFAWHSKFGFYGTIGLNDNRFRIGYGKDDTIGLIVNKKKKLIKFKKNGKIIETIPFSKNLLRRLQIAGSGHRPEDELELPCLQYCDIVILGGSLSAFSAAIASSSSNVSTCLIEPTDWIGGQMTSSGVPALDFCWHTLKDPKTGKTFPVYKYCRKKENITPSLYSLLEEDFSHTGKCWVSNYCFLPKTMLTKGLEKMAQKYPNLRIFRNTVIKSVTLEESENIISSIEVIQRTPQKETKCLGYDDFLFTDISDWYSRTDSARYTKEVISFSSKIFIEGSEWGELLVLSNSSYLQGLSEKYDGDVSREGNSSCGQSIVFGFTEKYNPTKIEEPKNPFPVPYPQFYSFQGYSWDKIFTYRRLFTDISISSSIPRENDITLQNWGEGNDFSFGYIFKSFDETEKEIRDDDWTGGVDLEVLKESSYMSYGWHYYFKEQNEQLKDHLYLDKDENIFGTCTGLSKTPYIRDTRRTIGINDFIMNISDISGNFIERDYEGTKFEDRVAIGCYDVDIHSIKNCDYPDYVVNTKYPILPFYIPFRAMTSKKIKNLLVTGKCIGQSFLVSAATRTHPTEYSIGTSTGAIAAWMIKNQVLDTKIIYQEKINQIQSFVKNYTPIDWNLD